MQGIRVYLVTHHEGEAHGGVGSTWCEMSTHRTKNSIRFLNFPEEPWIATRTDQEAQFGSGLGRIWKSPKGGFALISRQIQQLLSHNVDRWQTFRKDMVRHDFGVRQRIVHRQGAESHRV